MIERADKIEGPFSIEVDLRFRGMITRRATVRSGATLELHGMITGDLDVEPGAKAVIHGTVNGQVRNYGGYVHLYGSVDELFDLSTEAKTIIDPRAKIKGRRT
jgi:hypothetical protein